MTTSRSEQELREDLSAFEKKFKRRLVAYNRFEGGVIYAVYADEALTGFLAHVHEPEFGKFNSHPVMLFPLSVWVIMKALAAATVTPTIVLAKGNKVKAAYWDPVTGLKYAVRDFNGVPKMCIAAGDFKDV